MCICIKEEEGILVNQSKENCNSRKVFLFNVDKMVSYTAKIYEVKSGGIFPTKVFINKQDKKQINKSRFFLLSFSIAFLKIYF